MKTQRFALVQATALLLGTALSGMAAAQAPTDNAKPTAPAAKLPPPANAVIVIEDEGARIEETRLRGQVVRVQVQSKLGGAAGYEITLRPGRDPSTQPIGATGRSAWQLLSF